jgi:hypothetical protein
MGGEADVVGVAGPPDTRAEDLVEQQVPCGRGAGAGRVAGVAGQHERDRQAEAGAGRSGQAGVIRLGRPVGDEAVRAVAQRGGQGALQLADLVAAAAEAGEVVPLDPQPVRPQADGGSQPGRGLQRGREGAKRDALAAVAGHGPASPPVRRARGTAACSRRPPPALCSGGPARAEYPPPDHVFDQVPWYQARYHFCRY